MLSSNWLQGGGGSINNLIFPESAFVWFVLRFMQGWAYEYKWSGIEWLQLWEKENVDLDAGKDFNTTKPRESAIC